MNFDVPQYIDVEDKIAFQLTAKQLGWFGLGGVLMFFAWQFASQTFFIIWAVVIVLACLAMAFIKPYGITLASFFGYGFLYIVRPKQFIWQRTVDINPAELMPAPKESAQNKKEGKSLKDVDRLSALLDKRRI